MKKLLCLGDSITDCGRLFFHPPLGNGYVQLLSQKLSAGHKSLNIINCGVDGFTLTRLLEQTYSHYLPLEPDIITVLIGINDIGLMMNTRRTPLQQKELLQSFLRKYEELLQRLLTATPQIILMEPFIFPWPAEFQLWQSHVQLMSRGIADLAAKFHLPYIQLQDTLDQEAQKYGLDMLTTDGIHLTLHGHEILADSLFEFLSHIT